MDRAGRESSGAGVRSRERASLFARQTGGFWYGNHQSSYECGRQRLG